MGGINRHLIDELTCPFLFSFDISFEIILSCPGISEICKYNMSACFLVVPLQSSNIRLQLLTGIEGYLLKSQESSQFAKILKLLINSQDTSHKILK